jgi:copper transport protein
MRWPIVGVMSDVVHHGAAAVWVTGLAVIVLLLPRLVDSGEAIRVLRRFSMTAVLCVSVIVLTGVIQSVRLVGGVAELLGTTYGRLLIGKVLLVLVMLGIANDNRRRVHVRTLETPHDLTMSRLRRSVLIEFVLGAIVIGLTAALVVSTPGVADDGGAFAPQTPGAIYYTMS